MRRPDFSKIDLWLVLFFLLLMLLPFIVFSGNNRTARMMSPVFLPDIDTLGEEPATVIINFEDDTLYEAYPGIFSPLSFAMGSIPADTVIVTLYPDIQLDLGEGAGIPVELLFIPYPAALNPQITKVKPNDDDVFEGAHSGSISFSVESDDPLFDGIAIPSLAYVVEDNELLAGINFIYEADTFLTEGLTGVTLLVSMNSIPDDTVYVTADPDVEMRITGIPDEAVTLIFPPNSSSLSFQGVNVRAFDDAEFEGDHTGFLDMSLTTDDAIYAAFMLEDITYEIIDNDLAPGVEFSVSDPLIVDEGSLDEVILTIALHSIPTDTVTIRITPDEELRIAAGPGEAYDMVFAPNASALNDHIAEIKAFDDFDYEGLHSGDITFEVITADEDYISFTPDDLIIEINDNDLAPGIVFSVSEPLILDEATLGEVTITMALNSVPTDTVKIRITPDEELRIAGGPGEAYDMVFAPNTSALNDHIATVKAFDDFDYEGLHAGDIAFEIITTDEDYAILSLDPIVIEVNDNEMLPGILVEDTAGLAGIEGDTTLTFSMVLNSIPQYTVTINADPDVQLDLGKGRDVDVNYKFKSDSALIPQIVKITIYDDVVSESDHMGKIVFNVLSDDENYSVFTIDTVIVLITDNEIVHVVSYDPAVWNIYPTVSSGIFNYTLNTAVCEELQLYNSAGVLVYTASLGNNEGQIDITALTSGTYIAAARSGDRMYYTRITIVK